MGEQGNVTGKREEYLKWLESIPVTNQLTSASDITPKLIEWVLIQMEEGKSTDEIYQMLGVRGLKRRYLRRRLELEIASFQNPTDEVSAMTAYYVEQADEVERLRENLSDLDERIQRGPQDRLVTDGKTGRKFAVEDTHFNELLKLRIETRKELLSQTEKKFNAFLNQKKTKNQRGKYQGATIIFNSNVPRPPKDLPELPEPEDE